MKTLSHIQTTPTNFPLDRQLVFKRSEAHFKSALMHLLSLIIVGIWFIVSDSLGYPKVAMTLAVTIPLFALSGLYQWHRGYRLRRILKSADMIEGGVE